MRKVLYIAAAAIIATVFLVAGCGGGGGPEPVDPGVMINVPPGQSVDTTLEDVRLSATPEAFPDGTTLTVLQNSPSELPTCGDAAGAISKSSFTITSTTAPAGDLTLSIIQGSAAQTRSIGQYWSAIVRKVEGTWQEISRTISSTATTSLTISKDAWVLVNGKWTFAGTLVQMAITPVDPNIKVSLFATDPSAPSSRRLYLVHGLLSNNDQFLDFAKALLNKHLYGEIYAVDYDWRLGYVPVCNFLKEELARAQQAGKISDILGHSRGGVLARYTLEQLQATKGVWNLIEVDSPNEGSYYASAADSYLTMLDGLYLNSLPGSHDLGTIALIGDAAVTDLAVGSDFIDALNGKINGQRGATNLFLCTSQNDLVVNVSSALGSNLAMPARYRGVVKSYTSTTANVSLAAHGYLVENSNGIAELIRALPQIGMQPEPLVIYASPNPVEAGYNSWDYTVFCQNNSNESVVIEDISFDSYDRYGNWLGLQWYEDLPPGVLYPINYNACNIEVAGYDSFSQSVSTWGNSATQYPISNLPVASQCRTQLITARYNWDGIECFSSVNLIQTYNGVAPSPPQTRTTRTTGSGQSFVHRRQ